MQLGLSEVGIRTASWQIRSTVSRRREFDATSSCMQWPARGSVFSVLSLSTRPHRSPSSTESSTLARTLLSAQKLSIARQICRNVCAYTMLSPSAAKDERLSTVLVDCLGRRGKGLPCTRSLRLSGGTTAHGATGLFLSTGRARLLWRGCCKKI
jgi:hypothetical protein